MSKLNRRDFLKTAGATSAAAALAPRLSFGADIYGDNILVFVFLRGGIDGLSLLTPMNGHPDRTHYNGLRTNGTLIPSTSLLPLSGGWGLHPAAGPLQTLWNQQQLAFVHAVGLPVANRSHFEAERYVELGTPGNRFTSTGWLTRHLQTASNLPPSLVLPAVVTESRITFSLLREPSAVTLRYPSIFDFETGSSNYEEEQEAALADIYGQQSGELDVAGSQALSALELVETIDFNGYVPSNGASYPTRLDDPARLTSFGEEMKIIAQLIKEDSGLRVAQTDRGGWDTHNDQGNLLPDGWFYDNIRDLSEGLNAFFTDLNVPAPGGGTWADRTTMIVYSEFGRRVFDNADAGTDHGWGNMMMVLGGGVNGGQFYGTWPGLDGPSLFQGADIWATTDYRSVFSEVLVKRLNSTAMYSIFPGMESGDYTPLGIVNGANSFPDFQMPGPVFDSGFE